MLTQFRNPMPSASNRFTHPVRAINLLLLPLLISFQAAAAEETASSYEPGYEWPEHQSEQMPHWAIGVGAGNSQRIYSGVSNTTRLTPMISYTNKYVRVFGPSVDLTLPQDGPAKFSLRLRYGGQGFKASDSSVFSGMADRKAGIWAGGALQMKTSLVDIQGEFMTDASNKSNGSALRLGISKGFRYGAFELIPHASTQWVDSKYVKYYYGVSQSEATATRSAYEGSGTANITAGIRARYSIDNRQSIMLEVDGTHYGKGITESPLVDKKSSSSVRIGYVYRF